MLPFDYAVRNLGRSPRRMLAIVAGNALVVLLVLAAASFVEGMRASMAGSGEVGNVILLATGSEESLERSEIPASTPGILAASLRGLYTEGGVPFVSPEVLSAVVLRTAADDGRELRALVRGVTAGAYLVHERVEVTEGRAPRPGANELMAGSLAGEKMGLAPAEIAPGATLWLDGQPWTIVGRFRAPGTVMEAELWAPLDDLRVATKRTTISGVVVRLGTAEFADIDAFTRMRTDLELSAIRESEYYAALMRYYRPIRVMIWTTAVLAALVGILGGLNTLYSAFAARVREIGMLQSLGYTRGAIVVSLVQESMLAAAIAVFIAVGAAWLLLDGVAITLTMGVFRLSINSTVLATGAGAGLILGLIGALPPAWRCLRLDIPHALKSI
jgi:putative ABC transport system permease protein